MTPTVHDVIGGPVPGSGAVARAPVPASAVHFRELLDQLMHRSQPGAGAPSAAVLRPVVATTVAPAPAPYRMARVPTLPAGGSPVKSAAVASGRGARAAAARQALASTIRRAAARAGVAPDLSVAVARAESNLNPGARSPDGVSVGTFQLTHTTAAEMRRKFARGAVTRPAGNDDVAMGVGYLRYLHDLFGRGGMLSARLTAVAVPDVGERQLFAVAAYNAGEGRVAAAQARAAGAGGDPTRFADVKGFLPAITQRYVERVSGYAREESNPPTPV